MIAAALAAAALLAAPPAAAAETITAQVSAKVVKPLVLKHVQALDMGSVLLGPGTWSGATLRLARDGTLTCAAPLTCFGATQVAEYNVSGSNRITVRISAPDVTLVNQSDATKTLTMEVDTPGWVTLTNSGNRGVDFPLGGSVQLDSTTAEGTYVGTFNVTVDY
jgi:spore coat protein U-like protein